MIHRRTSLTLKTALQGFLLLGVLTCALQGQDQPEKADPLAKRYGLEFNPIFYPQKSPQEAMKSIVKAIDARRTDYLLAHLIDPIFVDRRIGEYKQRFDRGEEKSKLILSFTRLIEETEQHYRNDPPLLRELRSFAREADWEEKEDLAIGKTKSVPARKIFLRRIGERYFLENRQQ